MVLYIIDVALDIGTVIAICCITRASQVKTTRGT
jgi:hypothetical protein